MLGSVFMCIIISLFHSVNKYSPPKILCIKGLLGTGDTGINETDTIPILWKLTIRKGIE